MIVLTRQGWYRLSPRGVIVSFGSFNQLKEKEDVQAR